VFLFVFLRGQALRAGAAHLQEFRRRTKAEKKLLAQGKTCDRLVLVICFSVSGDFTGFQVRRVKALAWGVLAQMGFVLLIVIWLITILSTYFFVAKTWWLPVGASALAPAIDHHFTTTYILMGIVFVAAQLSLGALVWMYRDRKGAREAEYSHGNVTMEIVWTVLTAVLFVGLNLMSSSIWASERFRPADPGAVRVEVTGMQFAWYFRYPGPDGKFGTTKPELEDASSGGEGALGLDTTDPASKDDVVTSTMFVPVNHEVEVILRAQDVIHSFFVPSMRFKQDAVPGLAIRMHFTPTQTGDYEIACAELCGLGHYKMHGMLKVVSQDEFDKWLAAREAEKQ
jgi:cytochrome c oxidase subunit II